MKPVYINTCESRCNVKHARIAREKIYEKDRQDMKHESSCGAIRNSVVGQGYLGNGLHGLQKQRRKHLAAKQKLVAAKLVS